MRTAVVHDWLTGMRGGEKVLEAILELFPDADLYTLFHKRGSVSPQIESRIIRTSSLQKWATSWSDYRKLLPLFPRAIRQWDFSSYDLILSSSHCVVKGVRGEQALHVCYCHTPMRYIWDRFDDYFPRRRPLKRAIASLVARRLRAWDRRTASNVDHFVANSHFVRDRVLRYYGRDAEVIHPFVDDAFLTRPLNRLRSNRHVIVSALVPYKRLELAIDAANELDLRLLIIGDGPSRRSLERHARGRAEFLGAVPTETLMECLSSAQSLILPGVEDFGITPLEAMASGTPVVAFREGGALDTVIEGRTGVFFDRPESSSLAKALGEVEKRSWDRQALRVHAAGFSKLVFQRRFQEFLSTVVGSRISDRGSQTAFPRSAI